MKKNPIIIGFLYVVTSASLMASLPVLGKLAYALHLGLFDTLLLRYSSAFCILAIYLGLIKHRKFFSFSPLVLVQGIFLILASIFYFLTLKYLSAGLTNVIFFTHPVLVALLAILVYKERCMLKLVCGLLLALVGIALVSGVGSDISTISPRGFAFGMLASLSYALYSLISQKTVEKNDPLILTAKLSFIAFIVLILINGQTFLNMNGFSAKQLFIGCLIGITSTVLAVTFLMKGIKLMGASRASLISSLEPVITIFIAFLVLEERMCMQEGIGALLVCISTLLAVSTNRNIDSSSKVES